MSSKIRLTINNIKKSYPLGKDGSHKVIDNLSLDISDNEFLVILGPGHCGKSVLLNIIAGLEPPDEGSVMLDGSLYLLTWTSRVAFIYDAATLEYRSTYSYPRAGWGLTTDGSQLIASDGTSTLYFMDGQFSVRRRLTVRLDGRQMRLLNELEYIGGKIWANVYTSDLILIIDPETGNVEATVDASGLLPSRLRTAGTDVLNGIAYDEKTGKIYLTGKNWPRLYEIRLVEK